MDFIAESEDLKMAKRIENECAFCAEEIPMEDVVVGEDRKVYCSRRCSEMGETISRGEMVRLMAVMQADRAYAL
jgi:hypothetical protein